MHHIDRSIQHRERTAGENSGGSRRWVDQAYLPRDYPGEGPTKRQRSQPEAFWRCAVHTPESLTAEPHGCMLGGPGPCSPACPGEANVTRRNALEPLQREREHKSASRMLLKQRLPTNLRGVPAARVDGAVKQRPLSPLVAPLMPRNIDVVVSLGVSPYHRYSASFHAIPRPAHASASRQRTHRVHSPPGADGTEAKVEST